MIARTRPAEGPSSGFLQCRRGSALAEFALILPLLVLLFGSIIEISRAVYQYHAVAKGVQEAARFLSRREEIVAEGTCPPGGDWGAAVAAAKTLAMYGDMSGSGDPVLTNWTDTSTITVSVRCQAAGTMVSPLSPAGGTALPVVEVSATVPFNDIGLLGFMNIDALNITATHSELGVGG